MSATFRQKLRHDLAAPFRYDGSFNFPLLLVGVASVVHIGWSVATFVAFRRRIDTATMVIVDWDPSVFMMHIRIAIGLLLSVVGLFSRRVIGLFVSTLALVWVGVSGLVLLVDEDQVEGGGRNFSSSVSDFSNLYGASLWNLVVLVLVIAVLLWGTVRLIKVVRSQAIRWPDGGKIGR